MSNYRPETDGCSEHTCHAHGEANRTKAADYEAGRAAYRAGDPESALLGKSAAYDLGYWDEHNESYVEDSNGIEDGYGDFYDYDAVSQGMYDDDPSPYNGDYSEM